MKCPCIACEKKGCGVYHDVCADYQKYVQARQKINERNRQDAENRQISRDQEIKYRRNLKMGVVRK